MRVALSGCFDLFHNGHRYLLQEAWRLANQVPSPDNPFLIICLNTDLSIKNLKGANRPVDPFDKRVMNIFDFLSHSNIRTMQNYFILPFDTEEELLQLYRTKQPDLIIHGDDIEDITKATGYGEFNYKLIERIPNISTTEIISNMKPKHYIALNKSEYYNDAQITELSSEKVKKVWGTEEIIHNDHYCLKVMTLKPKHQVSMHWHSKKTETFILIKGTLIIETINTQTAEVKKTILTQSFSSFTLEPDVPHTFYTEDNEDVVFIEGSTYDDPFDSYRMSPSKRRE